MGEEFAEHLHAFAQLKGIQLGTIARIEKNPEQSKHLETATMKAFGLDIDFVNLRSEEYAAGSRIPTGVVCPNRKSIILDRFLRPSFPDVWYSTGRRLAKRHNNKFLVLQRANWTSGRFNRKSVIVCV